MLSIAIGRGSTELTLEHKVSPAGRERSGLALVDLDPFVDGLRYGPAMAERSSGRNVQKIEPADNLHIRSYRVASKARCAV